MTDLTPIEGWAPEKRAVPDSGILMKAASLDVSPASYEELNPELVYALPYELDLILLELGIMRDQWDELAKAKAEAMTQSSETWHDNAPEIAVRNDAQILSARQQGLSQTLAKLVLVPYPSPEVDFVTIGSRVEVRMNGRDPFRIDIVGVSVLSGRASDDEIDVASYQAPLAKPLIGRPAGSSIETDINGRLVVVDVLGIDQLAHRTKHEVIDQTTD